jgi:hypothetical protein
LTGPVSIDAINQDGNEPPHIRPSHEELTNKIIAARRILLEKGFYPAEPTNLAVDFRALDLYRPRSRWKHCTLHWTKLRRGINYRGARPPDKSYEPAVWGEDLFPFSWASKYFGRDMYVKFCLDKIDEGDFVLYIFSLHEDRPGKGRRK